MRTILIRSTWKLCTTLQSCRKSWLRLPLRTNPAGRISQLQQIMLVVNHLFKPSRLMPFRAFFSTSSSPDEEMKQCRFFGEQENEWTNAPAYARQSHWKWSNAPVLYNVMSTVDTIYMLHNYKLINYLHYIHEKKKVSASLLMCIIHHHLGVWLARAVFLTGHLSQFSRQPLLPERSNKIGRASCRERV